MRFILYVDDDDFGFIFVNKMGFFDKVKSFGSKIVSGIRKGWDFVKQKVVPGIKKILPTVQKVAPMVSTALGHPELAPAIQKGTDTAQKILSVF